MAATLDSLNYQMHYYYKIIRNVCHTHHAKLVDQPLILEKPFTFNEELKNNWYDLFGITNKQTYIPFTYFLKDTDATMAFFDFLNRYDLSLANVLHVKSSLWLGQGYDLLINHPYKILHRVEDILPVSEDRICFIGRSSLFDLNGNHVLDIKNGFIIKNLSAEDAHLFDSLHHHPKHQPDIFKGLSKKNSLLANDEAAKHQTIFIPENLGTQYGLLSGDMNPIHTNHFLAKLTGAKGAFIQGLCTINAVIAKYALSGTDDIEKINITFCRKIYENQTIHLLTKNTYYELIDDNKELLACGRLRQYLPKYP